MELNHIHLYEHEVISDNFFDIITEKMEVKIPSDIKTALNSPSIRRKMLSNFGEKAFLLPGKLLFPILNPKTGKLDCRLLYAAYIRSKQWSSKPGYREISLKAREMINDNSCSNKLRIQLENSGNYDFIEFLDIVI